MEDNKELVPVEPKKNVIDIPRAKSEIVKNYELAVTDMLNTKPFYAKLIMSMHKIFSTEIPTAGVGAMSTGIKLYINPAFFNAMDRLERVAVLEHEALHVIHAHFGRFGNFEGPDRKLANFACDIAINQYIPYLPEYFMVPGPDGKMHQSSPVTYKKLLKEMPDLLPKMSSEYYFNKFKEEIEKNPNAFGGLDLTDDHGQWEKTDLTQEQLEKMVKSHVKAILDTCSDKERAEVDKSIIDELYKSEINWKSELRSFFANSEETFTISTRKKRNRRYDLLQPGNKNEQKLRMVIANDTSGSVGDDELQLFYGEIDRIYDENTMELWILEADTSIKNCFLYKKGMKIEAKGRGGTAYSPAFLKAKELKADAMIYFGDMDCSDIPQKPKFPVLWGIVRKQKPPVDWGKAIYISKK